MDALRILVVEDDHDARQMLAAVLAKEGFVVEVARDGTEAIHVLEDGPAPYAALLDLKMPGIIGQEVVEFLAHDRRFEHTRVAIVSASPQLAPAGYRVFPKPLDVQRLLEFLRPRRAA
jgi:CheY-like chemotaxis protein